MKAVLYVLVAGAVPALAQAPADLEKNVRAAMAPALAQQRASIHKQASSLARPAAGPAGSFFLGPPLPAAAGTLAECDPLPPGQLDSLSEAAAEKEGVDPQLVRAVIDKESAGRPCAVSFRGAAGLMQLMPATAEQFEVRDPLDPQQNVEAGTRLLRLLLDRYGNDTGLALSAYNAGATRVDQEGGIPAIPETLEYVTDILSKLNLTGSNTSAKPRP